MESNRHVGQLLGLLLAVLMLWPLPALADKPLPLRLSGPDDIETRTAFAVLQEAYSRLGIEVEAVWMPTARSLTESEEGRTDGEIQRSMEIDQGHPNLILVPIPVNRVNILAFTRDYQFKMDGWKSLTPYRTGIPLGTRYATAEAANLPKTITVIDNAKLIDMLLLGRLDILVFDDFAILEYLEALKGSRVHALQPPLETLYGYHYLHADNEKLVPKITQILADMERSGRILELRGQAIQALLSKTP